MTKKPKASTGAPAAQRVHTEQPNERCQTCRYFAAQTVQQGVCRRNPPTAMLLPIPLEAQLQAMGSIKGTAEPRERMVPGSCHPTVDALHGWCGEWVPTVGQLN